MFISCPKHHFSVVSWRFHLRPSRTGCAINCSVSILVVQWNDHIEKVRRIFCRVMLYFLESDCLRSRKYFHVHLPSGVLEDVPHDGGRGQAVVVAHADIRAPHLVHVCNGLCPLHQLFFPWKVITLVKHLKILSYIIIPIYQYLKQPTPVSQAYYHFNAKLSQAWKPITEARLSVLIRKKQWRSRQTGQTIQR